MSPARPLPPVVITNRRVTGAGGVQYAVKGIGTITLAPCPSNYQRDTHRAIDRALLAARGRTEQQPADMDHQRQQGDHLVAYWTAHDPTDAYPHGNWTDPAHVNGIPLHGYSAYAVAEALDALTDPSSWWVRPHRHTGHRYGGGDLTDAARRKIAWTLAHLTADYTNRPDVDDLAHAHTLAHAAERATQHARDLQQLERDLAELTAKRDTIAQRLATQQALADLGPTAQH